jgi:putative membrane protein
VWKGGHVQITDLPTVNASLNGLSAVFLTTGYAMIRRRRIVMHRGCMIAACVTSTLFLATYTVYHAMAGSKPFPGHGPARAVYFVILISHIVLAAAVLPLAVVTLARGLGGKYAAHVRIARWTLPVWLYVSVTGVAVYLLLYHL